MLLIIYLLIMADPLDQVLQLTFSCGYVVNYIKSLPNYINCYTIINNEVRYFHDSPSILIREYYKYYRYFGDNIYDTLETYFGDNIYDTLETYLPDISTILYKVNNHYLIDNNQFIINTIKNTIFLYLSKYSKFKDSYIKCLNEELIHNKLDLILI
jgi:hypothetical protein